MTEINNAEEATRRYEPEPIDWNDVREPGAYLHIDSGMLMRVFADELVPDPPKEEPGTLLIRLSNDPQAPLARLRATAMWLGYLVQF